MRDFAKPSSAAEDLGSSQERSASGVASFADGGNVGAALPRSSPSPSAATCAEKGECLSSCAEAGPAAASPGVRSLPLSALLGAWVPLPLPPLSAALNRTSFPSLRRRAAAAVGAVGGSGPPAAKEGILPRARESWTPGAVSASVCALPPLAQVVGVSGLLSDGPSFCGGGVFRSCPPLPSPPPSPLFEGAAPLAESPSTEEASLGGVECPVQWEVLTLREDKAAGSPRESLLAPVAALATAHQGLHHGGGKAADSHSLCCTFSSGGADALAAGAALAAAAGSAYVLAAAVHDCNVLRCADRSSHAALRRCVFLLQIPCVLSGASCSAQTLRTYLSTATASLGRSFSLFKCKRLVAPPSACGGGDSPGGSGWQPSVSAEEELASLLAWGLRAPLSSASCVRLGSLSTAASKGGAFEWTTPMSRASSGSLCRSNSGGGSQLHSRGTSHSQPQLPFLHQAIVTASQGLGRGSEAAGFAEALSVPPLSASALPLFLESERFAAKQCSSCGGGGEGGSCLCAVKTLLGDRRERVVDPRGEALCASGAASDGVYGVRCEESFGPSFLLVCGARLVSVCRHLESVSLCTFLGPTPVTPLLMLAETAHGTVFLWRSEGDCLFQLVGRLGLRPLRSPSLLGDSGEAPPPLDAAASGGFFGCRPSRGSSYEQRETGACRRVTAPLGHRFALLEVDDRALQLPRVCFGLDDSSPLGAVPRLHVLFAYQPASQQQPFGRRQQPLALSADAPSEGRGRDCCCGFMRGAFAVDALARGVYGHPVLQQVAGSAQLPFEAFGVEEILDVALAEVQLWADSIFVDVNDKASFDDLLGAGSLLGAPVLSGRSFCGCSSAGPRLEAALLCTSGDSSRGSSSPPVVAGEGCRSLGEESAAANAALAAPLSSQREELQWGDVSGFLASVIPPCRFRVLTSRGEELLLLLSPAILRIRRGACEEQGVIPVPPLKAAASVQSPRSSQLELRYSVRCLSSSSLLLELPALAGASPVAAGVAAAEGVGFPLGAEGRQPGCEERRGCELGTEAATVRVQCVASLGLLGVDAVCLQGCGSVLLWRNRGLHGGEPPLCCLQSAPFQTQEEGDAPEKNPRLTHAPPVGWMTWLPTTMMELFESFAAKSFEINSDDAAAPRCQSQEWAAVGSCGGRLPLLLCLTADRRRFFLLQVDLSLSLLGIKHIPIALGTPLAPAVAETGIRLEALKEMFEYPPPEQQQQPRFSPRVLAVSLSELSSPGLHPSSCCSSAAVLVVVAEIPEPAQSPPVVATERGGPSLWLLVFGVEFGGDEAADASLSWEEARLPSLRMHLLGAWRAAEEKTQQEVPVQSPGQGSASLQPLLSCSFLAEGRLLLASPLRLGCETASSTDLSEEALLGAEAPPCKEKVFVYLLTALCKEASSARGAPRLAERWPFASLALTLDSLGFAVLPRGESRCVAVAVAAEALAVLSVRRGRAEVFVFSLLGLPLCLANPSGSPSAADFSASDGRRPPLPLEATLTSEVLSPVAAEAGAEESSSSGWFVSGEISVCRMADARLALLVKKEASLRLARRSSSPGVLQNPMRSISVFVQKRRGARNCAEDSPAVASHSSWSCVFHFEQKQHHPSRSNKRDGGSGLGDSNFCSWCGSAFSGVPCCEEALPSEQPQEGGGGCDAPRISNAWWSADGALLLFSSNEGQGAPVDFGADALGGDPQRLGGSVFCRLPGTFFLAAEGALPAASAAQGCALFLPATQAGLQTAARSRARASEWRRQEQIQRCPTTANAAAVDAALTRARSRLRDLRVSTGEAAEEAASCGDATHNSSTNLRNPSQQTLLRFHSAAAPTAGSSSASLLFSKQVPTVAETERQATVARAYGRCPLYKPEVLLQLLRLGAVGTVKWILRILLRCLLVSGVCSAKRSAGALLPAASEGGAGPLDATDESIDEARLCRLCQGRVGCGGGGRQAVDEKETFCSGALCVRQRSCEFAGLLQVCLASAAFALVDLFSQQLANDALAQLKASLEAASRESSPAQAELSNLRGFELSNEAAGVASYVAFASRCLPPRFRPSDAAVAEALRERHLQSSSDFSGNARPADAALSRGTEDVPWLGFVQTNVSGIAAGERRAGAASCLFDDDAESREADEDPFDVQSILGLGKGAAKAPAGESPAPSVLNSVTKAKDSATPGATPLTRTDASGALLNASPETRTAAVLERQVLETLKATSSVDVSLTDEDFALLLRFLENPLPALDVSPNEQIVLRAIVSSLQKLKTQTAASTLEGDYPAVASKVEAAAKAIAGAAEALSSSAAEKPQAAQPSLGSEGRRGLSFSLKDKQSDAAAAAIARGLGAAVANVSGKTGLRRVVGVERSSTRFALALWRLWELETSGAAEGAKQSSDLAGGLLSLHGSFVSGDKNLPPLGGEGLPAPSPVPEGGLLSSEDLCWAIHASAEEEFLDLVLRHCRQGLSEGRLSWPLLRLRGVGFWLRRPSFVRRLSDELLKDAMRAAASEAQATSCAANVQTQVSHENLLLPTSQQVPSTEALPSSADWVALWAAASGKKGVLQASFKAQGNTRVRPWPPARPALLGVLFPRTEARGESGTAARCLSASSCDCTLQVVEFLGNDFTDERWRTAAEKNAFKLLAQRRAHLALAFLCLGRRYSQVADVCCRVVKDAQLALMLLRTLSAWTSPEASALGLEARPSAPLRREALDNQQSKDGDPQAPRNSLEKEYSRVLLETLLPQAEASGDVWLSFCCHWLAGNHASAFAALVPPYCSDDRTFGNRGGVLAGIGQEKFCAEEREAQLTENPPFPPASAQRFLKSREPQTQTRVAKKLEGGFLPRTSSGGGAAAANVDVFEDGHLKHAAPSLALPEFRSAVAQTLPLRRLAAEWTQGPSGESLRQPGLSREEKAAPAGEKCLSVGEESDDALVEERQRRRALWALRHPAEAVETDLYLLTSYYVQMQDPFMAAAAVTSLLAVRRHRQHLFRGEDKRDLSLRLTAPPTDALPQAALPTVFAALRLFAAACAPPLLLSSLVSPQRLWCSNSVGEGGPGSNGVAPLLGFSRGLLLFLTSPDMGLLLDASEPKTVAHPPQQLANSDETLLFKEWPPADSALASDPEALLPAESVFPSLRTKTPWFFLASLEGALESYGSGTHPLRPFFKEAMQRSRSQLFLSPFGVADATVAARSPFLRRASSSVLECLDLNCGAGAAGGAASSSPSQGKPRSRAAEEGLAGLPRGRDREGQRSAAEASRCLQPFAGVVDALSWRLAGAAERLLSSDDSATGGGVSSPRSLLRIRCPSVVHSALCDLALLSSELPRSAGLSGSEGTLLLHAAADASAFASHPAVAFGGGASSASPSQQQQGTSGGGVSSAVCGKPASLDSAAADSAGEDASCTAAHFVSLAFCQMLGAVEAAEERADSPLVFGRSFPGGASEGVVFCAAGPSGRLSLRESRVSSCGDFEGAKASSASSRRSSLSAPTNAGEEGGGSLGAAICRGRPSPTGTLGNGTEEDNGFRMPLVLPLLQCLVQELLETPAVHPKSLGLPALYCALCACVGSLPLTAGKTTPTPDGAASPAGTREERVRRLFASSLCGSAGLLLGVVGCFPAVFAVEGSPLTHAATGATPRLPSAPAAESVFCNATATATTPLQRFPAASSAKPSQQQSAAELQQQRQNCKCAAVGREPFAAALELSRALRRVAAFPSCSESHDDLLQALQALLQPREGCAFCLRSQESSRDSSQQQPWGFEAFVWGTEIKEGTADALLAACIASCVSVRAFEVVLECLRILGAELLSSSILLLEKMRGLQRQQHALADVQVEAQHSTPNIECSSSWVPPSNEDAGPQSLPPRKNRRAAAAQRLTARLSDLKNLKAAAEQLTFSVAEFLYAQLRPALFRAATAAAPYWLAFFQDCTSSLSRENGRSPNRWISRIGGDGLAALWISLGCAERMQWVMQRTSFLPLPPWNLALAEGPNGIRDAPEGILHKGREVKVDGSFVNTRMSGEGVGGDRHFRHPLSGRPFTQQPHVLRSQEPFMLKANANSVFESDSSNKVLSSDFQQQLPPGVAGGHALHSRPLGSVFVNSNLYTRHPQPLRPEFSGAALLRQVDNFLSSSKVPAVSCVFAGNLDSSALSICCRQSSWNCFETTRLSERFVESCRAGGGRRSPGEESWQTQAQQQSWGVLLNEGVVDSVPLAALLGPTAAASCACGARRHFLPFGLSRSGEVAFGVAGNASEGGVCGLRTLDVPPAFLGIPPSTDFPASPAAGDALARAQRPLAAAAGVACMESSTLAGNDGGLGGSASPTAGGEFVGLGAASRRLRRRLRGQGAAAASEANELSPKEALLSDTAAGAYLAHLARRDAAAFGVVQVARMSAAARLLAWLSGPARGAGAAETETPPASSCLRRGQVRLTGGSSSGKTSLAESVDSSGSASWAAGAAGPLYPYSVFPSLSSLRAVFDFTGSVAAHPFLPVFTALLRAPSAALGEASSSRSEAAGNIFMAALRPFGPCARSLPRPPRRPQLRGEGPQGLKADVCASSHSTQSETHGAPKTRQHSVADTSSLAEVAGTCAAASGAAPCPQSLDERKKSGVPQQEGGFEDPRLCDKTKKDSAAKELSPPQVVAAGAGGSVPDRFSSRKGGVQRQSSREPTPVAAAVWTPQGDALAVADAAGGVGIYWLQRGPLLPPAAAGEALGAANFLTTSLAVAPGVDERRARQTLLQHVPLQLRRACSPALYWKPHAKRVKQVLFADGCGGWLLTLGVGVPQGLLMDGSPVLIPGVPYPKTPFSRSALQGIETETAGNEEAALQTARSATFARTTSHQNRASSWTCRAPHLPQVNTPKCRRRAAMFRLLANARNNGHSLISRLLSARAAGARLLSGGRTHPSPLPLPRSSAFNSITAAAGTASVESNRSRWRARNLLFSNKCHRHTVAPTAEGRGRSKKVLELPRRKDDRVNLPPSEKEDSWLFQDSNSWASGLLSLSTFVGGAETPHAEASESRQDSLVPVVSDACICVWRLAHVSPTGSPRLEAVVTCDDLLDRRMKEGGGGSGSRNAASKERAARVAEAAEASGLAAARFWNVVATHEPTCMCLAVFQEGHLSCACCLEAAGGCTGSCCSATLSTTCCGGSCGALRCVIYGDAEGKMHAVELGLQEEVLRWQAHESQPVLHCSIARASSGVSAAPEVWLATAARPPPGSLCSSGGLEIRCWSVVGLGEGGPALLHQVTASPQLVLPPGLPVGPSSNGNSADSQVVTKASKAGGAAVTPGAALARLLGASRKGQEGGIENSQPLEKTLLYLGGRTFLSVDASGITLLIHV